MMINKQKIVNPENLPVIEWQGVRVVTTETLAAGYGTTPIRIQQNYIRNEDRFVEGKHFFKISGDELKSFRLSFSESVNKHTTSLVLWTERGAGDDGYYVACTCCNANQIPDSKERAVHDWNQRENAD